MKREEIEEHVHTLREEYLSKYRECNITVERASLNGSMMALDRVMKFIEGKKKCSK